MSRQGPPREKSSGRKSGAGKTASGKRISKRTRQGRKLKAKARSISHFPTPGELAALIAESPKLLSKKEIFRLFALTREEERELLGLLDQMVIEGKLISKGGRYGVLATLPEVTIVEIMSIDDDGEAIAIPVDHKDSDDAIHLTIDTRKQAQAPGVGDRALARILQHDAEHGVATIIRVLPKVQAKSILGVFRKENAKCFVDSTDKKDGNSYLVPPDMVGDAREGELVRAETLPGGKGRQGLRSVKVVERLGSMTDSKAVSLIAIHANEIPYLFPDDVLAESTDLPEPTLQGKRVDLRHLPLVTIDGSDARDFDDAVFAEPDPEVDGGWHLVVAIADVAHYVRPGSALDTEAKRRGNSVYFPDRVVPMLPEALSNGLCSLRPDEDRFCLAMHMWIGPDGTLSRYKLQRALMRSHARLTYEQVQQAMDGNADTQTKPLMDTVIRPLYQVHAILTKQRKNRGALEIDLPEYVILFDEHGQVEDIRVKARLDSHKLIEECMILANVAAALLLQEKRQPALHRNHEMPEPGKIAELSDFLETIGYSIFSGDGIKARHFNQLFKKVHDEPIAAVIYTASLRSQMQAYYSPDRLGHFGLALEHYTHFTSPIRRYSDLIVHRALIRSLRLGDDPLTDEEQHTLESIGVHISMTERRAMQAEREARDRYTVQFHQKQEGEHVTGIISGMARSGIFVMLERSGGDGYIPLHSLNQDYFTYDERRRLMRGRRTGMTLHLGDRISARIIEADALTGRLRLELLDILSSPSSERKGREKPQIGSKAPKGKKNAQRSKKPMHKGKPKKGAPRKRPPK